MAGRSPENPPYKPFTLDKPSKGIHDSPLKADYTHMRCLYCGNELALLKRLTGGGEFCSEAHKKSYQEEYNRIALTRLLQAQARAARATPQATPSAVSVAIEEPVAEKSNEKPEEVHLEPGESGFLLEEPLISAPLETPPYGEPWQEVAPRPSAPAWLFSGTRNSDMPSAALLPLESRPRVRDNESTVQEADLTPNEFAAGSEKPPVPFSMVPRNTLEGAGPIALKIPPQVLSPGAQGNLEVRAGFLCEPPYRGCEFLGLFPSTIEFPAEDAEVTVISLAINTVEVVPAENHHPSSDSLLVQPESEESVAETMPGAAHEDLARTHLEEAGGNDAPVEIEAAPIVAKPENPAPSIPEPTPVEKPAAAREAPLETNELSPRATTEFIEIVVKAFAPPKPSPIEGAAVMREKPVLLPRLTGLPLRPKVALAPSQSAVPPKAPAAKDGAREREGKQNAQASTASPAPGPSIILGEGGWVEGWGGDPAALKARRTADHHLSAVAQSCPIIALEFQASIDTKSIGMGFPRRRSGQLLRHETDDGFLRTVSQGGAVQVSGGQWKADASGARAHRPGGTGRTPSSIFAWTFAAPIHTYIQGSRWTLDRRSVEDRWRGLPERTRGAGKSEIGVDPLPEWRGQVADRREGCMEQTNDQWLWFVDNELVEALARTDTLDAASEKRPVQSRRWPRRWLSTWTARPSRPCARSATRSMAARTLPKLAGPRRTWSSSSATSNERAGRLPEGARDAAQSQGRDLQRGPLPGKAEALRRGRGGVPQGGGSRSQTLAEAILGVAISSCIAIARKSAGGLRRMP
jgi:hypothetical protein